MCRSGSRSVCYLFLVGSQRGYRGYAWFWTVLLWVFVVLRGWYWVGGGMSFAFLEVLLLWWVMDVVVLVVK